MQAMGKCPINISVATSSALLTSSTQCTKATRKVTLSHNYFSNKIKTSQYLYCLDIFFVSTQSVKLGDGVPAKRLLQHRSLWLPLQVELDVVIKVQFSNR